MSSPRQVTYEDLVEVTRQTVTTVVEKRLDAIALDMNARIAEMVAVRLESMVRRVLAERFP